MITYINAENAAKYKVLFADAQEALYKLHEGESFEEGAYDIGSLEEYFANLPELLSIGNFSSENPSEYDVLHSLGRRYSMLPLANEDEEIFKIDANTRLIEVPSAFKANGVGVKDDQLAEILYFTIDRFFDITDLDSTDLYIQWESPSGAKGVSKPWVIDIYSDPSKITFGWAVCDKMTDSVGNLKFAVRFVTWNSDLKSLAFSFATQVQSIAVKPTLDIDFIALAADGAVCVEDNAILYRLKNSNTFVTGRDLAEAPVFDVDLPKVADLVDDALVLEVKASTADTGSISYVWNKVAIVLEGDVALNSELDAVGFEPLVGEPVEGEKYWIEKTVEGEVGTVIVEASAEEIAAKEGLLVKVVDGSKLDVGALAIPCGSYQVTAVNKKTGKNVNSAQSGICIVPQPTMPVINKDLDERAVFDKPEGAVTALEIKVSNDADKVVLVGEEEVASLPGVLSYVWFKDGVEIAGENEAILDLSKLDEVEGVYTVKAINTKNRDVKEVEGAVPCRVSLMPVMPAEIDKAVVSINGEVKEGVTFDGIKNSDAIVISVDASKAPALGVEGDSFEYQWMLSTDADFDFEDVEPKDDIVLEGETGASLSFSGADMSDAARYYCVFTYKKNGEVITGHSDPIKLIK